MPLALVLEDDTFSAMALNALLEDEGFSVAWFANADLAAASLNDALPDVVIADWQVEGETTSADIARLVRTRNPAAKVAFVTGYSKEDILDHLIGLEPYLLFSKPLDYDHFLAKMASEVGLKP
jgi:CheY-like chemotaxis protein